MHVIDATGRINNSGIMSKPITQDTKNKVRRHLIFDEAEPHRKACELKQPNEAADVLDNVQLVDLAKLDEQKKLEQMLRWNFDFANEIPLNGDWQWERVSPPNPIQQQDLIKNLEMDKEVKDNDRNV